KVAIRRHVVRPRTADQDALAAAQRLMRLAVAWDDLFSHRANDAGSARRRNQRRGDSCTAVTPRWPPWRPPKEGGRAGGGGGGSRRVVNFVQANAKTFRLQPVDDRHRNGYNLASSNAARMHAGLRGEGGACARICNPLPGGFGHQPRSTTTTVRGASLDSGTGG